jgi:hypothetical protein
VGSMVHVKGENLGMHGKGSDVRRFMRTQGSGSCGCRTISSSDKVSGGKATEVRKEEVPTDVT